MVSVPIYLPISQDDIKARGWNELDIIIVTGDAYVDHPSFGSAVIARVLEAEGFRVGIIAQPDWRSIRDFTKLGKPRLFFGVTSGNIDSMLNHYTANKKLRHNDAYSPGNKYGLRPNRAVIVYTNRLRESFGCIPIIIGGIEASLRRLAHYDYWDSAVRRSILLDSRADMLVYGMGEQQIVQIAKKLQEGKKTTEINDIPGTTIISKDISGLKNYLMLPSYEEVKNDKEKFNLAAKIIIQEQDPFHGHTLIQPHANQFVVQLPPSRPLSTEELDKIYELPFTREWHPVYDKDGGVPALKTVQFSITSHRGCYGECSFCSLYYHMGRIVESRSIQSIVREAKILSQHKDFKGIITDIGGPTANMYTSICPQWKEKGACKNKSCIMPQKCIHLTLGYPEMLKVWEEVLKIQKIKKVFVGTGIRYDLLLGKEAEKYIEELCSHHVSGQLKVAPEHVDDNVLKIMNKPSFSVFEKFFKRYNDINKKLKKKQYLVQYFISSHPGSTLKSMLSLAFYVKKIGYFLEQVQDFIPMPMTRSTAMYYTGKDPLTGKHVYCARVPREKMMQRALIQFQDMRNKKLVIEALTKLEREDLIKTFYGKKDTHHIRRREDHCFE